jgi:hypothetical protein
MKKVEVFNIGTKVQLNPEITATIIGINIRSAQHLITYECGWWNSKSYDTKWFYAEELKLVEEA